MTAKYASPCAAAVSSARPGREARTCEMRTFHSPAPRLRDSATNTSTSDVRSIVSGASELYRMNAGWTRLHADSSCTNVGRIYSGVRPWRGEGMRDAPQ